MKTIDNEWIKKKIMEDPDLEFGIGDEMTEMEKLKQRLTDMGVLNFRPFWGPEAENLTVEERAKALNGVLDAIESGDCKEIFDIEYGLDFVSHEQAREFYRQHPEPNWSYNDPGSQETYIARRDAYEKLLPKLHEDFINNEKNKKPV